MLPRLCFTINETHMKIEMNDVNKQAHSSLFAKTKIQLRVYAVVSDRDPYRKEKKIARKDFMKPELVLIFEKADYFDFSYIGRYVFPFKKQAHLGKKFIAEVGFF